MTEVQELPVIFRESAGEVVAIFPTIPCNNRGDVTLYAHIGQHGGCSWSWYRSTRKATPTRYRSLLMELRGIYEGDGDCLLRVVDRYTSKHRDAFNAEMRKAKV